MDAATAPQAAPEPEAIFMLIPLPRDGEAYAGVALDHGTGKWHHLFARKEALPSASFDDQIKAGIAATGEPPATITELAIIRANCPDLFTKGFFWSSTPSAGNGQYAWGQAFLYGDQLNILKDYYGRAVAVRRTPI